MNESAKQFEPGELTQKELRKERLKTLAGMYQNKTRIWVQRSNKSWVDALISAIDAEHDNVGVLFDIGDGQKGKKNLSSQETLDRHNEHVEELKQNEHTRSHMMNVRSKEADERVNALKGQAVQIKKTSGSIEQYQVDGILDGEVQLPRLNPMTHKLESLVMDSKNFFDRLVDESVPNIARAPERKRSLNRDEANRIEANESMIERTEKDLADLEKSAGGGWVAKMNPLGQYRKLRSKLEKLISTPTGKKAVVTSGMRDSMKDDIGGLTISYFTRADLAAARKLSDDELIAQVREEKIDTAQQRIREIRERNS